ncbi:MAG TPA: T9SS type A sorting domain-containing protein [Gemmatimonadales bacterium]|nr:T9SS type A sorting domain-containing protein [Gemmatimonadales bacterium]
MRRVPWLFVLTLFVPQAASSLQLHWNSGLTDLTFSEAKCCTLVVQADAAEGRLPPEWRLVWAADSAGVSPVPLPPEASCQQVAEIQSISAPTTPTEIAANIMTARFCSSEGEMATTARFAETGSIRDWDPQCDNWAEAVAVKGDTVFVGGNFSFIGGQTRTNLAALDAVTAAALPWRVDANSDVITLSLLNDTLYAGGSFSRIGGAARSGLAAIDPAGAAVLPWAPEPSVSEWLGWGSYPVVRSLVAVDHDLYVGGAFGRIDEVPASNLAAISFGPAPPPPPPTAPQSLALAAPRPNPVRNDATLRFALPAAGSVDLAVYDVQGRRVSWLLRRSEYPAGIHDLPIKATGWPEGFYFLRLESRGRAVMKKFVVLE